MSDKMIELGKRAVACFDWVWIRGMRTMSGARVVAYNGGWECARGDASDWADYGHMSGELPDLTDPATLGCLLGLVREAHGVGSVVYLPQNGGIRAWRVVTFAHGADWLTPARLLGEGDTEAEALVAALEAAP